MFIKKVLIKNFKSYKDTSLDDLSSNLNVIVGHNGSGKTNFLTAIQCVLNPESYNCKSTERLQYINEEEENLDNPAIVEVILDNSDSRIPIDKDEISIRRIINSKKDSFFIDQKSVSKQEMLNFLESIGFSKTNPYHIVKQGKVNELAVASDSARYELLLDIAGGKVYKEKREESIRILEETGLKRQKINEHLTGLNERLNVLENEKKELIDFHKHEKEKRMLEYIIYQRELNDSQRKLDSLHNEKQQILNKLKNTQDNISDFRNKLKKCNDNVQQINENLPIMNQNQSQDMETYDSLVNSKSMLEFELNDLKIKFQEEMLNKEKYESVLKTIDVDISEKEHQLLKYLKKFEELKELESLYRDRIKSLSSNHSINVNTQENFTLIDTLNDLKNQLKDIEKDILKDGNHKRSLEGSLKDIESKMTQSHSTILQLKQKRSSLLEEKKSLWLKESENTKENDDLRQKLLSYEKKWSHVIPKDILVGFQSLEKICNEYSIEGVYGPVLHNFTTSQHFYTAVSVTAGNKLFNILVDNSKIATRILKIFKDNKIEGQVTFMPLEQLNDYVISVPKIDDAIPLISKISFDPKFSKAFNLIFGHTVLCRNKDIALKVSKECNVDGVTLDGDQVIHKGIVIGGYMEQKLSVMDTFHMIQDTKQQLSENCNNLLNIQALIEGFQTKINDISNSLQKEQTLCSQYTRELEHIREAIASVSSQISSKSDLVIQKKRDIAQYDIITKANSSNNKVNESNNMDISQLNSMDISELESKLKALIIKSNKILSMKNELESSLNTNLYVTRNEFRTKLSKISSSDTNVSINIKTEEYDKIQIEINKLSANIKEMESTISTTKSNLHTLQENINEIEASITSLNNEQAELFSQLETITNKKSLIKKKHSEAEAKTMNLGVIPDDVVHKYNDKPLKWMWKNLNKCNEILRKSNYINKKAVEEFLSLSNERDSLEKQNEELNESFDAIYKLIKELDERRNKIVLFTFKQISHNFTEIFSKLLQNTKAYLILKKHQQQFKIDEDITEDIESFSQVSIKVSFNEENNDKFMDIQQLSGGQKTLLTLAFIFAIQKCDPVPFYIFDEVDQALDPHHRQTFAKMIGELSQNAQFITTTFRPDLLNYSSKCFGVQYKNRVSYIMNISAKKAKSIVNASEN